MTRPGVCVPAPPVIGITAFDSATVFDGLTEEDIVYRYDLTSAGIEEGWACDGVIEQVRQLAGTHWPQVMVRIDAAPRTVDALNEEFAVFGVRVLDAQANSEDSSQGSPEPPELDASQAVKAPAVKRRTTHLGAQFSQWRERLSAQFDWEILALAGAVMLCLVLAIYAALRLLGSPHETTPDVVAASTVVAPPPPTSTTISSSPPPLAPAEPILDAPIPNQLDFDAYTVALPAGFILEPQEKGVRAVGEDPNVRIYLSGEPATGSQQDVVERIRRSVEADPQLNDVIVQPTFVEYTENPGDGSKVRWRTWVHGNTQFYVGCHFRDNPTKPQLSACDMAAGSLKEKTLNL